MSTCSSSVGSSETVKDSLERSVKCNAVLNVRPFIVNTSLEGHSVNVILQRSDDIPFGKIVPPKGWDGRNQCGICADNIVNCLFRCGHTLCYECAVILLRRGSGCPVCRKKADICFALRLFAADVSQNEDKLVDPIKLDACQICNTRTTIENVFAICGHTACPSCGVIVFRNGAICPVCGDKIAYLLKVYL